MQLPPPAPRWMSRILAMLSAIAVIGTVFPATAAVTPNFDTVRNDRWRCRKCPFELGQGARGHAVSRAISTTDDEARFGRNSGLDSNDVTLDGDIRWRSRNADGRVVTIDGARLGTDARSLIVSTARAGRYRFEVARTELPRREWTRALTPYADDGSLPAGWVAAFNTGGMTALDRTTRPLPLGTDRKSTSASASFRPAARWQAKLDAMREQKRGRRLDAGDFLYQATHLLTPVDQETDRIAAGLRYEAPRWLAAVNVERSTFDNAITTVAWDNPYTNFGITRGSKGSAPDNEADRVSVVARWLFPRSSLATRFSRGRQRQDAPFLPYSVNPALVTTPLPALSLQGEVDTTAASVDFTKRFGKRTTLTLKYRLRERDHATRPLDLDPVLGELFAPGIPEPARLIDTRRESAEARVRVRTSRGFSWLAGVAREDSERSPADIEANTTKRAWVGARFGTTGGAHLRARYLVEDRSASPFVANTSNNPLTRRYHQAERERRGLRLDGTWPLHGLATTLGITASSLRIDYPASGIGLQSDDFTEWMADITWTGNRHLTLSAYHGREERDLLSSGSAAGGPADWFATTQDLVTSSGLTVEVPRVVSPRLSLQLDVVRSDGVGETTTLATGAVSTFPLLVSDHRSVNLSARYRLRDNLQLRLDWYSERYTAADWALDGIAPTTIGNVLTTGLSSPDYHGEALILAVEARL